MGETLALFERRLPADEQPVLLDTLTWERLPADPRRAGPTAADAPSSGERQGEESE
jgi:hypothetical protein